MNKVLRTNGNMLVRLQGMSVEDFYYYLGSNGTNVSCMGFRIPDAKTIEINPDELVRFKRVWVNGVVSII